MVGLSNRISLVFFPGSELHGSRESLSSGSSSPGSGSGCLGKFENSISAYLYVFGLGLGWYLYFEACVGVVCY